MATNDGASVGRDELHTVRSGDGTQAYVFSPPLRVKEGEPIEVEVDTESGTCTVTSGRNRGAVGRVQRDGFKVLKGAPGKPLDPAFFDMHAELTVLRERVKYLENAKQSAVLQAQCWASECRTQKGIVGAVGALVGEHRDWETFTAVREALANAAGPRVVEPVKVHPNKMTDEQIEACIRRIEGHDNQQGSALQRAGYFQQKYGVSVSLTPGKRWIAWADERGKDAKYRGGHDISVPHAIIRAVILHELGDEVEL